MKVITVKNYEELGKVSADIMLKEIKSNPKITLGLATGGTPVSLYENLIEDHKKNKTSYKDVVTFNLDEYVGLERNHKESYYTFMNENLLNHIDIKKENVHVPDGSLDDPEEEAKRYNELLAETEIDIQLIGIGNNGHVGFNEPGSSFDGLTEVVELSEDTIKANCRYFDNDESQVPRLAISMGIGTIKRAKKILLIASGTHKAPVIKRLIEDEMTTDLPISALKNHPDFTVVIDEDAASLLSK